MSFLAGVRDFFGFFSNVRRIREALERLSPPGFVDARRKRDGDLYKPRTFQSPK